MNLGFVWGAQAGAVAGARRMLPLMGIGVILMAILLGLGS